MCMQAPEGESRLSRNMTGSEAGSLGCSRCQGSQIRSRRPCGLVQEKREPSDKVAAGLGIQRKWGCGFVGNRKWEAGSQELVFS